MFFLKSPLRIFGFLAVALAMFMMGPSFVDFSSESIVEYATFYVNLGVIVFGGLFMRGMVNQRVMVILGLSLIANHYLFYAYLALFPDNIYARFWCMFVSTLPIYLAFNYYTYFQCRLLSVLEKLGVSDARADRLVGPIGTTNLVITFNFYATLWIVSDFIVASYASIYGLLHGMPTSGSVIRIFESNNHINIFLVYETWVLLVDAVFTIILAHRVLRDQKRPDALGIGHSMTWDKTRSIRSQAS